MSDSPSFEDLLKEEGSAPIQKISKVKADVGKARVDPRALARARRLAEKGQDLDFSGFSTDEPPMLDPNALLSWTRDGFNKVKRHLDVERFDADYRLDLHGKTVEQSALAIQQMLERARKYRWARLQIVHGIGRRSAEGKPLLKSYVNRWLREVDDLIAFSSARQRDGGAGALNILTRGLVDEKWPLG